MDQFPQTPLPPTLPPSQPPLPQNPSHFHKYYFFIIGILTLILVLIPLLLYPRYLNRNIATTLTPTPTPSFTLKNATPAINSVDQNIQSTLTTTQSNIALINQLNSSQNASNSSKMQNTLQATIQLLLNTNDRINTLSQTLAPLINSSSNSAALNLAFVEMNNNIGTIKTTLAADTSLISLLTPTNNNRQKTLTTILGDLGNVQISLSTIRKDLATIRTGFFAVPSLGPLPCTPPPSCLTAKPACKIAEPAGGWCTTTLNAPSIVH